ncbi:hypothetical protein GCM10017673_23070 [Streptosporangium violaceochromogenes]|nr:hypothetical protein GCM10017673_23070 [Streptosporangium violaceochromogenes]
MRTEDTTLYALPNGAFRAEFFAGPIRVKQNNQLVPVDTTLVNDNGLLRPKSAKGGVGFSTGGTRPLVTITDGATTRIIGWDKPLPVPESVGTSHCPCPNRLGQATARARIGWDKPLPVPESVGTSHCPCPRSPAARPSTGAPLMAAT